MADTAESVIIAIEAQMDTAAITRGARVYDDAMAQITRSASAVEQSANRAFSEIATSAMAAAGPVQQFTANDLALAQSLSRLAQQLGATAQQYRTITADEIAAAQAVAGFARATAGASADVVGAHGRMGASGMILQHVVRSTADQFASGAPAAQIFAQHIGMVGEAAALGGSSMGRFGAIMAGPWGIAISAGSSLLTVLTLGHHSASEGAHSHETAEQTLIRALNGEADAVGKVTDALRAMREESDRAVEVDGQRILRSHALAEQELRTAIATRQRLAAQLEAAQAEERSTGGAANDPTLAGEGGFNPGAAQGALQGGRASEIAAQIAENEQHIADANRIIADTATQMARQLSTAVGSVTERFNELDARLLHDARVATAAAQSRAERARIAQNLARVQAAIAIERERALHSAQAIDQANAGITHRGPGEDVVDRTALLRTALSHVGQTERGSTATLEQFFRGAGISIDPRQLAWCAAFVQAVLAANSLPVARGPDGNPALGARGFLTYGSETSHPEAGDIVVMRRSGAGRNDPNLGHVGFFQGFEGNQVRVLSGNEGRDGRVGSALYSRADVLAYRRAPTASEAQTQEQRAAQHAAELADRRTRDEEHYQEQLARFNAEILDARRRTVQTEDQTAAADIAAIVAERDQRNQRIRDEAADRTRRDASQAVAANVEAGFLLARSNELAQIKIDQRLVAEQHVLDEQRLDIAQSELRDQASVLQARAQLARTAVERRDIELRLLDLQHQEELNAIAKQRLQQNLSPAQRAQLDRDEAAANTRYGLAQQNTIRQTAGPLEGFLNGIPKTAAEMNEALQEVAVDGLQQLNTGLGEAASRFLHLGGVAGHVLDAILNDMIQIILRQAELAAFGGSKGGGWSGFLSNLGAMFGRSGGTYTGELLPGSNAVLPGFAFGGAQMVGGAGGIDNNVVSINGRARFRASDDETIAVIPQGKALAFNNASAHGAQAITYVSQTFVLDARHGITTPELLAHVNQMKQEAVAEGAQSGVMLAEQRAYRRARQSL